MGCDDCGLAHPFRAICITCRKVFLTKDAITHHAHKPLGNQGVFTTAPIPDYDPPNAVYCDAKGNLIEGDDHD